MYFMYRGLGGHIDISFRQQLMYKKPFRLNTIQWSGEFFLFMKTSLPSGKFSLKTPRWLYFGMLSRQVSRTFKSTTTRPIIPLHTLFLCVRSDTPCFNLGAKFYLRSQSLYQGWVFQCCVDQRRPTTSPRCYGKSGMCQLLWKICTRLRISWWLLVWQVLLKTHHRNCYLQGSYTNTTCRAR